MANNYLITGYHGEPHVTVENDRGINAGIVGAGRFVLPVGQQFRAEYIGNNTVRVYDGKLMNNGAAAGIPAGKYIDLLIPEAGQGMKRNDLIVFQYSQDSSTLIESGEFVVVQGTESSGTAVDPELTQEDLLTDEASFDQMALWRVPISGATISAPVQMFTVSKNFQSEAIPADGSVTTAKVADESITRKKLAADALYSPHRTISSATDFVSDDLGRSIYANGNGKNLVITMPLAVSQELPTDAEIAVFYVDATSVKIAFDTSISSATTGDAGYVKGRTYKIPDKFGVCALKKIGGDTSNQWWVITGNVEVV